MLNRKQKIRLLGLSSGVLSLLYIILFFVFSANDSPYFSRANTRLVCTCYGLILLAIGIGWLWVILGKKTLQEIIKDWTYTSSQETMLDDNGIPQEERMNRIDANFSMGLIAIHMFCALFLVVGEVLFGADYSAVVVAGFVYAILWCILGLLFGTEG